MDGFETVRTAHHDGRLEAPVVALTASASTTERDACAAAGFQAFLTKPVEPRLLRSTVASLLTASPGPSERPLAANA